MTENDEKDSQRSRSNVYRLAVLVSDFLLDSFDEISEDFREIKKILRVVRYAAYGVLALVGVGVVFEVVWILVGLRNLASGISLGGSSLMPAVVGFVVGYIICLVTFGVFSIAK